ncbi:MAG: hypothetical protein GY759_19350 [Chloroflexi bacterium]|nr:hypothetical protein [Chloroflexota bacterium]
MKSLAQHLAELPLAMLQAIAQNQGLAIAASGQSQYASLLLPHLQEQAQISLVWEELNSFDQAALRFIVAEGNRAPVAIFQRRFGELRRFGSGRLQQDKPWLTPTGSAERLWYRGLITRGFDELAEDAVELIGIPTDLLPLLPISEETASDFALPHPQAPPISTYDENERLPDDLATMLIYLQSRQLYLNRRQQWRQKDLQALLPQWQVQPSDPENPLKPGDRPDLIWHLARQLGFLKTSGRRQQLAGDAIRGWLAQSRMQQAQALFLMWQNSNTWNDLCLTPHLHCDKGNWRNDPISARQALLDILAQFEPDIWYRLEDLVKAIYEQRPDFQRPDGKYDVWYIRDDDGVYLKSFSSWLEVEARLIRFIWRGPLHWLGTVKLDEDQALWCLSQRGALYLNQGLLPEQSPPPPLVITADFRVHLPIGTHVYDRFRVARFCSWEASWPGYRYQIRQRGLRRAAASGLNTERILDFLTETSENKVPANVRKALINFKL